MGGETIKFADAFSGIGGFRLGLERCNDEEGRKKFECVWSCDNDRWANAIYEYRWGKENHHAGDIRDVDPRDIPDHDIFCAGFPCPSFSLAGKRKGFADARGALFHEICRIARVKRPPLLLLENVRGLLSNDKGKTFAIVLESLEELGYLCEWQSINGKHWVPQNRERVFVVGHLGGVRGREVFPVREVGEDPAGTQAEARGEGAGLRNEHDSVSRSRVGGSGREENLIVYDIYNKGIRADGIAGALKGRGVSDTSLGTAVARTISGRYYKDGSENLITVQIAHLHPNRWGNWFKEGNVSPTIDGAGSVGIVAEKSEYEGIGVHDPNTGEARRVYFKEGKAPPLKSHPVLVKEEPKAVELAYTKANMKAGRFSKEVHALDGGSSKGVIVWGNTAPSRHTSGRVIDPEGVSPAFLAKHNKIQQIIVRSPKLQKVGDLYENKAEGGRVYSPEGISQSLKAEGGGLGGKTGLYFVGGIGGPNRLKNGKSLSRNYSQGRRIYDSKGVASTLPSQSLGGFAGNTGLYLQNFRIRRLTPRECERLMGLPDDWTKWGIFGGETKEVSDTRRYKAVGNSVVIPLITFLGKRIRERCFNA